MGLLVKLGVPCDRTLCDTAPVDVQVHVTVLPTATVSIAGFWLPLWALLNRMFPTTTSPDGPPPPPPPPPPPYVGDLQPASAASASKPITAVPIRISSSWVIRNERDCLHHGGNISDRSSMAVSDATAEAGAKQRNRLVGRRTTLRQAISPCRAA